jgi:hypothetical protein
MGPKKGPDTKTIGRQTVGHNIKSTNLPPQPSSGNYTVAGTIKEFKRILVFCLLYDGFFVTLLAISEDGGDMTFGSVHRLSTDYTALYP